MWKLSSTPLQYHVESSSETEPEMTKYAQMEAIELNFPYKILFVYLWRKVPARGGPPNPLKTCRRISFDSEMERSHQKLIIASLIWKTPILGRNGDVFLAHR